MSETNITLSPKALAQEAIALLKQLISTQSFSREEEGTAALIEAFFQRKGIPFHRKKNNIWAYNRYFNASKPTVLLNSHHDTVKPNPSWTINPYEPLEQDGNFLD